MFDFTDLAFMTGIVMALSEMFKRFGVSPKFIPVLNLLLGIVAGMVYVSPQDTKTAVLSGIVIGLTSSGLYSGTKNISQGLQENK
ncbi:holin [Clostridium sp. MSJ-11]|uniref:Holin n=1 Tax=Clostridium mobile TaxID=2841512 RepID=A0ABS6EMI2_9CLOT|nr:holin [Clostridium mobile]MBU5486452.1 holin [Clostridium mobile]